MPPVSTDAHRRQHRPYPTSSSRSSVSWMPPPPRSGELATGHERAQALLVAGQGRTCGKVTSRGRCRGWGADGGAAPLGSRRSPPPAPAGRSRCGRYGRCHRPGPRTPAPGRSRWPALGSLALSRVKPLPDDDHGRSRGGCASRSSHPGEGQADDHEVGRLDRGLDGAGVDPHPLAEGPLAIGVGGGSCGGWRRRHRRGWVR
jgi:hypothetical protein